MPAPTLLTFFSHVFLTFSSAFPLTKRQTLSAPVITTDFPDPSIICVDSTWYAFGTQSIFDYRDIRVQLATSNDFETWTLTGEDAMVCLLESIADSSRTR